MAHEFYIDYGQLDGKQKKLIDAPFNRNTCCAGPAGSGKSVIALHIAKKCASTGESFALVVFTKTLKNYFKKGLEEVGLSSNVYHYHHWRNVKQKVKYLLVDECQDFTEKEITEFLECGELCYFFGDSAQSIYKFKQPTVQSVEETAIRTNSFYYELLRDYRVTKKNMGVAGWILPDATVSMVEDLVDRCVRHGENPRFFGGLTIDQQLDKVAEIIQNRSLTSVGILLANNTEERASNNRDFQDYRYSVEYVKDYLKSKNVLCEFKYNDLSATEMNVDFDSDIPKVMTWHCSKGLQFEDVFLIGCDKNLSEEWRSAMYVAATRSCERLYLMHNGPLPMYLQNNTSTQTVTMI